MANAEMKTLTIEDTTFEIVDGYAREMLGEMGDTPVSEQIAEVTTVVEQNTQVVQELQTQVESKVDQETVTQLETDLKTYVDEQLKTVTSDSIDDGRL